LDAEEKAGDTAGGGCKGSRTFSSKLRQSIKSFSLSLRQSTGFNAATWLHRWAGCWTRRRRRGAGARVRASLWRDKWTTLSGPPSPGVRGFGLGGEASSEWRLRGVGIIPEQAGLAGIAPPTPPRHAVSLHLKQSRAIWNSLEQSRFVSNFLWEDETRNPKPSRRRRGAISRGREHSRASWTCLRPSSSACLPCSESPS